MLYVTKCWITIESTHKRYGWLRWMLGKSYKEPVRVGPACGACGKMKEYSFNKVVKEITRKIMSVEVMKLSKDGQQQKV